MLFFFFLLCLPFFTSIYTLFITCCSNSLIFVIFVCFFIFFWIWFWVRIICSLFLAFISLHRWIWSRFIFLLYFMRLINKYCHLIYAFESFLIVTLFYLNIVVIFWKINVYWFLNLLNFFFSAYSYYACCCSIF